MNPTGLLLVVVGVFLIARTIASDETGETLAGRLAGGQPSPASTSSSTTTTTAAAAASSGTASNGAAGVVASNATGLAAQTHSPAFAKDVLNALGAPTSSANVSSLVDWFQTEGNLPSVDQYNPLDTTLPQAGSYGTNSVNVQSYPNWAEGVTATAKTLLGGGYSAIVAALKSGVGLVPGSPAISSELHYWSSGTTTGGYGAV